jgi:hypothetical protein
MVSASARISMVFQGLEVLRCQEHSRRLSVHGHVDAFVLATDSGDQP